jgi:hypothetical protein
MIYFIFGAIFGLMLAWFLCFLVYVIHGSMSRKR